MDMIWNIILHISALNCTYWHSYLGGSAADILAQLWCAIVATVQSYVNLVVYHQMSEYWEYVSHMTQDCT